eukprot:9763249-Lingulodinium_polyedra.AAC.1
MVFLDESQPLVHGKRVPAIVSACTKHWKSFRSLGHQGVAVEHYCWARAGLTVLERVFRQLHKEEQ